MMPLLPSLKCLIHHNFPYTSNCATFNKDPHAVMPSRTRLKFSQPLCHPGTLTWPIRFRWTQFVPSTRAPQSLATNTHGSRHTDACMTHHKLHSKQEDKTGRTRRTEPNQDQRAAVHMMMVPLERIELSTPPLPRVCSTSEP